MKCFFEGRCMLVIEHQPGDTTSQHIQAKFNLYISPNLDRSRYLDAEGLPTAGGVKCLTNVFVQGLIGNIHSAHQNGFWNDAEHIRYIIAELERGFVENAEVGKSTF